MHASFEKKLINGRDSSRIFGRGGLTQGSNLWGGDVLPVCEA